MKRFLLTALWVIASLILIVAGAICLFNPALTLSSLALFFGIVMLINGIFDIVAYVKLHKFKLDSGWVLAEGILTILLAILLLFNREVTALTIPIIFTIWIIISGVSRIINSFDLKKYGFGNWWLSLVVGILMIILGCASVFDPILAAIAVSTMVGILFIAEGISSLVKGYYVNRVIKNIKEILK